MRVEAFLRVQSELEQRGEDACADRKNDKGHRESMRDSTVACHPENPCSSPRSYSASS